MKLHRILRTQGLGTRRQCVIRVRAGEVAFNDQILTDPEADIPTENLALTLDGETWQYREKAYLAMNKPAGYECSRMPSHHPSVFSLLPAPLLVRGVQCVGRLDADTTGLLLFSDDGDFVHRVISPKKAVTKVYRVRCKHRVADTLPAALTAGVKLKDEAEPVAAIDCVRLNEHDVQLTIGEGKYHQVKRMIAAAGNRVVALDRVAIGGFDLPADLPPGGWRWLAQTDLTALETC